MRGGGAAAAGGRADVLSAGALGLLEELAGAIAAGQRAMGAEREAAELEHRLQKRREWAEALESAYGEFGVPKETEDFCWLYLEQEAYCINDVIRIRRGMLGLTGKELCGKAHCSEKILRRLECGGKKIQKAVMEELAGCLGLSAECCRIELVTEKPEAEELMRQLRKWLRERDNAQADRLIDRLEGEILMELPSNRQVLMRCRAINEIHKRAITREQCLRQLREALACTLPYEAAMGPGEKYLTNEEISCIQNMVCWNNGVDEEKKRQIALLERQYEACERDGLISCFLGMYEIAMGCVASELGNIGEYDRSDEISRKIIKECLLQRRTFGIPRGFYNMLWNEEQRQKEGIPVRHPHDPEKELKRCIAFSELGMEKRPEEFYRGKLQARKTVF